MGWLDNVLDWAADKVQTVTGEKERRENVAKVKETYETYRWQVETNIDSVNSSITELNNSITELNAFRADDVPRNLISLGSFLNEFGNVKEIGEYAEEETACYLEIPTHRFISIEDYISDIDWSQVDVFVDSFILGPIGMKMKTQKQNLSIQEKLNALKIESEQTLFELQNLKLSAEQDIEIANLYIYCVKGIIHYIETVIIPELDVVEGFFQALAIKNKVIAEEALANIPFKNRLSIIQDTAYQDHYHFVRNAFLFYVVACKIYNTPVLTNLFMGNTSEEDYIEITQEKNALEEQMQVVGRYVIFQRGGI